MTTTLSTKGQIVIPLEFRRRLGLPAGAVISCYLENGRIILEPEKHAASAAMVAKDGYFALEAPHGSPEMAPERVKEILAEL